MRCYGKNNNSAYLWLSLLISFFISGCERVTLDPDNTRTGFEYSPLQLGDYRTYQLLRINYNFAAENDTLFIEFKELLAEAFINQEGDSTFVVHKMHRRPGEERWKLDSISHWRITPRQLIEHSNNKDIVRLVFPVGESKIWDSNLYNTQPADSFRMVGVHKPLSLVQHPSQPEFEQTITVIHRNIQDTIVRQDIRREVFAHGIGPVYRLVHTLNYCATQDCIGKGIINSGLYQTMTLIEYGKE